MTTPTSRYYCSTAYLVCKNAAIEIIAKYWDPSISKYNLAAHHYVTADAMIADSGATYSIPIFTYQITNSTIHPHHLALHKKSRLQQTLMWQRLQRQ